MFNMPNGKEEFLSQFKSMTSTSSSSLTTTANNVFGPAPGTLFPTSDYNIWDCKFGAPRLTSPSPSQCTSSSSSSLSVLASQMNKTASIQPSDKSVFDTNNNDVAIDEIMNSIYKNNNNNNNNSSQSKLLNKANLGLNNNNVDCFNNNSGYSVNIFHPEATSYPYTLPTPCVVDNVYTAASRNQEEYVAVKSCAHVSYIVGKQGKKIREIRNLTQTYIETPVNGEDPVFIVRGTLENIARARDMILKSEKEYDRELYEETQAVSDGEVLRFNLFLPARYIGLVVGRQGYFVKKIMDSCDVVIITPKINTINLFKISGIKSNVFLAVDQIKKHIEETTDAGVYLVILNDREIELEVYQPLGKTTSNSLVI